MALALLILDAILTALGPLGLMLIMWGGFLVLQLIAESFLWVVSVLEGDE